jgi:hypothetical protein
LADDSPNTNEEDDDEEADGTEEGKAVAGNEVVAGPVA